MAVATISNLAGSGGIDESLFPNTMTLRSESNGSGSNGNIFAPSIPTFGVYKTATASSGSFMSVHSLTLHKADGTTTTIDISNGGTYDISDAIYVDYNLTSSANSGTVTNTITLSK